MKIDRDTTSTHTTEIREIHLTDGPVIDAGQVYAAGTQMQVTSARIVVSTGAYGSDWKAHVHGWKMKQDGTPGRVDLTLSYYSLDHAPDWLREIAHAADEVAKTKKENLPLILAMDDDYCPTSKDNRHHFAEDGTCDLCGANEEEA